MTKKYNWKELLILSGFQPELTADGTAMLYLNHSDDRELINLLLRNVNLEARMDGNVCFFSGLAPKPTDWFAPMMENERGVESGDPYIHPINLEFPMNSLVIQFNRLGLKTIESCRGFAHRRRPYNRRGAYVMFDTWRDAITAYTMLQTEGYNCTLQGDERVYINEAFDAILDIGLWLSKLQDIEQYQIALKRKRETRLMRLLDIPGKTGDETLVGEDLMLILKNRLDKLWIDEAGNVLGELTIKNRLRAELPCLLLSAHQDVVDNTGVGKAIIRDGHMLCRDGGILGADDRAGIAAIINSIDLLKAYGIPCNLKIAFTVHEESGQLGARKIAPNFFDGVDFAVSMDRRGTRDIVYRSNTMDYAKEEQTHFIKRASEWLWKNPEYHYKACTGGTSDLAVWSQDFEIPSVNLSIGYSNEHTDSERLDLEAWHRAQDLLLEIIFQFDLRNVR